MILFKTKKMGKQIYIDEINASLPDKLKTDIDILVDDVIEGEMDLLIILDGKEGSGKSYDARLIAKYISTVTRTPFGVDNIHFSTEKYMNFSESMPKYTINVLDESREALNKRRGMSKSNVMFTNWLSENRDKQQIHIIVLPAIHDLDSYISIWRMRLLIHKLLGHGKSDRTRSGYKLVRGFFKVYDNNKDLQQVMYNKAKYGSYAYPRDYKYSRKIKYTQVFTDEELKNYKMKKAAERRVKYQSDKKKKDEKAKKFLNVLLESGLSRREIARKTGMGLNQVCDLAKEAKEDVVA